MTPGEKGCSHGKYWKLSVFFDDDTDGTSENRNPLRFWLLMLISSHFSELM